MASLEHGRGEYQIIQADADGWIPWHGGECPLPDSAQCMYRMRDGEIDTAKGSSLWWHVEQEDTDIVAYRPILDEPSEPEAPEWAIGERCIWRLADVCMGEHVILSLIHI